MEEGTIPTGTVFKKLDEFVLQGTNPPATWSEDLLEDYTNAWYTTLDRDPFEWSYRKPYEEGSELFEYVGFPLPLTDLQAEADHLELVSGPRWRLKANKFGQDIPGLEIPRKNCAPPPYTNDMIKYNIGERTSTVINLLDWDEEENGPSPLATSIGWVDMTQNLAVSTDDDTGAPMTTNGIPITTNGLPMTDDFDLAVYIKGDRKPTALFTARLEISYDGEVPPTEDFADFDIVEYGVRDAKPTLGDDVTIYWIIKNNGPKGESQFVFDLHCICSMNQ